MDILQPNHKVSASQRNKALTKEFFLINLKLGLMNE